jgi:hypothetical protein
MHAGQAKRQFWPRRDHRDPFKRRHAALTLVCFHGQADFENSRASDATGMYEKIVRCTCKTSVQLATGRSDTLVIRLCRLLPPLTLCDTSVAPAVPHARTRLAPICMRPDCLARSRQPQPQQQQMVDRGVACRQCLHSLSRTSFSWKLGGRARRAVGSSARLRRRR